MKNIKKASVLGAGIMGHGIAQVLAMSGIELVLLDIDQSIIKQGLDSIEKSLQRFVKKGKIPEADVSAIMGRITSTTDFGEATKDVDLVIEAIPEDLGLKRETFKKLDELCPTGAVLASNTSTISITAIAAVTRRPENVIGMHFANPVPMMVGVEIIRGLDTSEETVSFAQDLVKSIGKKSYIVEKDAPGFIGNRILPLFINEAFNLLWEGIGSPESIDQSMKLSLGHPMGPLELADLIGLDQLLKGLEYLTEELGEKFKPSPMLKQLVIAGYFGRKTGRGVYTYQEN